MTPATTEPPRMDRAEAYAKITHRIYEDRRASPQARELLLAVAYALCIAPGDPGPPCRSGPGPSRPCTSAPATSRQTTTATAPTPTTRSRAGRPGRAGLPAQPPHRRSALPARPQHLPGPQRPAAPGRRVPPDTLRWQHYLAREATPDALLREGFTAVHEAGPS